MCSGLESALGSCSHNGWGNVDCNQHTRDADVIGKTILKDFVKIQINKAYH